MPTSKIIYASSDSNAKYQAGNSPSDFEFSVPEGLVLASADHVLSIAFKGIFIPGKIIDKEGKTPNYIKIHLSIIQFQRSGNHWDQCLSRLLLSENRVQFIEPKHNKPIPVINHNISDFHIKITDEKNQAISIIPQNTDNPATIIKLEVSTLKMNKQGGVITCSSADLHPHEQHHERYTTNNLQEFRTWLPTELDAESQIYEVGLTSAIIPKELYSCTPNFSIAFDKYNESTKSIHTLTMTINDIGSIGFDNLLHMLNRSINNHKIPIEFKHQDRQIKVVKRTVNKIREDLNTRKSFFKWKKYLNVTDKVIQKCICEPNLETGNEAECSCKKWTTIAINEGLAFLFSGNQQTIKFHLDNTRSETAVMPLAKKDGYVPSLSAIYPTGLKIYTPIVTPTIVGREQENLVEIIPFLQTLNNEKNKKTSSNVFMYYPNEITYHNVQRAHIKELLFQVRNMTKNSPLYNKSNLPITLVLHFRPI